MTVSERKSSASCRRRPSSATAFRKNRSAKASSGGPHLIGVDAGSTDPGPYYLGGGKSFTNRAVVKRDLRFMLTDGVRRGVPVVVGTAGGSGARPHVAWCEEIVREIAARGEAHLQDGRHLRRRAQGPGPAATSARARSCP